jgi:hypothetical protein
MALRLKVILSIIGFTLLFFLVAPYLLGGWFAITQKPHHFIHYAEAVQGRITSVEIERQFHKYYLDNNTKRWYSFNEFMPALNPAQQQHLSQEEDFALNLGQNLEVGDYVTKQPNSTLLTVQRGDSTSRWFCSLPKEAERAQNATR